MPAARVGAITIAYDWYPAAPGADHAPPLVIVPGLAADPAAWTRLVAAARRRGPVLIPAPRGAGGADAGPRPERTTLADLTHDLAGLLETLGIGHAHLLGHSLGGMIALDFVLRRPATVGALILLSTTPEASPPAERARVLAFLDRLARDYPSGLPAGPSLVGEIEPGMDEAARLPAGGNETADVRSSIAAAHALATRPDQTPHLGGITVPTLVLVGEQEGPALQHGAELLHGWIPTSRLVRVEGAGHPAAIERPEAFELLVLSFLAEVDASESP
jgi:pimeloyl-ACP methyl ester carboxylesterase